MVWMLCSCLLQDRGSPELGDSCFWWKWSPSKVRLFWRWPFYSILKYAHFRFVIYSGCFACSKEGQYEGAAGTIALAGFFLRVLMGMQR